MSRPALRPTPMPWPARAARRLGRAARRLARREDGTATIEFVILFPVFVLIMTNAIEGSVLMMRGALLDRGLDMAVRELRLGTGTPPSFEAFRALICDRAALIPDCMRSVNVDLRPVSTQTWDFPQAPAACIDRREEIDPLNELNYRPGVANELMVVRACVVADPVLPNFGLGLALPKDPSGGYMLLARSAYVQEP